MMEKERSKRKEMGEGRNRGEIRGGWRRRRMCVCVCTWCRHCVKEGGGELQYILISRKSPISVVFLLVQP